jgi:CRP-like cAMP-binding protein
MQPVNESDGFKIWGVDDQVYGPVELPTLISWVQDDRVTASTWVYSEKEDRWYKGEKVPELQIIFGKRKRTAAAKSAPPGEGPNTGAIRRVKILAALSEEQLEKFATFMDYIAVRQWSEIVLSGQPGDAMYLILEGELRVRIMVGGKEKILTTLSTGEFFGEIALFDHGARSADVVANMDSKLLKVSTEAFDRLIEDAPDLAAPILHAIGKTLAARIRADNKRFKDDQSFRNASDRVDQAAN